jgi:hypothetical protein
MTTATLDKSELFIRQWAEEGTLPKTSATWSDVLQFEGTGFVVNWTMDPVRKQAFVADVAKLVDKTHRRLGGKKPRDVMPDIWAQGLYGDAANTTRGVRAIEFRLAYKPYKTRYSRAYSGFAVTGQFLYGTDQAAAAPEFATYSSPVIALAATYYRKERYMTFSDAYNLLREQPEAAEYR